MTDKNISIKKDIPHKNPNDVIFLVEKKMEFFKDIIQKTIIHVQKNKSLDILGISDLSCCIERLGELNKKIGEFNDLKSTNSEALISGLQLINNELSSLLKNYGTYCLEDLLLICFGNNNKIITDEKETEKFELLKKYFHPTSYKVVVLKKEENKQTTNDDKFDETTQNLSCYDISTNYKQFHMKVFGMKIFIHNSVLKKTLVIFGIVDDVIVEFLNNKYVNLKHKNIKDNLPNDADFQTDSFNKFMSSLILKDYLIYDSHLEIYNKYAGYLCQNNLIKQKQVSHVVKEFISDDIHNKRNTLITLLIKSATYENQYLAYLLYDLLSNDTNGTVDTQEQIILFDSFPWPIKQYFKQAMKKTVQYTNELSNFDINKIPLEQQICLLKASDTVKEKAMMKLKEVKAKAEDSGSKARQYLDGLLKIPFSVYKREPILNMMETIRNQFKELYKKYNIGKLFPEIPNKEKYTSIEVLTYIKKIQGQTYENNKSDQLEKVKQYLITGDKKKLNDNIILINELLKKTNLKDNKIKYNTLNKDQLKVEIEKYMDLCKKSENKELTEETIKTFINICNVKPCLNNVDIKNSISSLNNNMKQITDYMTDIKSTLDKAVHGHDKAKKQLERIIGQWINGEQDGYCFGFEGPPGVGKCLAKNTPIMLSDGEIKMVQDITLNDKLMGDDNTPRNVLALGNGRDKMYIIEQALGDDYVVNESHILSLKITKSDRKFDKYKIILGNQYFKNNIVDICVKDYLSLPKYLQECLKGYKVGIDFCEQNVSVDPYALGYCLGDELSHNCNTVDEPVIKYFQEYAKINNLYFINNKITDFKTDFKTDSKTDSITNSKTHGRIGDKNIVLNKLKDYSLNNKHIPKSYKCNSREIRLQLLAGLIDSDGYHCKAKNALVIMRKNKVLAEDILWLVRSLGFRGIITEYTKYSSDTKYRQHHNIIITGPGLEKIPTLLDKNKVKKHKQTKQTKQTKEPLTTCIHVVPLEEDEYFGFQIDGNFRFLLGDFTVTHNTSLAKRGLADCLKDNNGISRPFSMIQMGGDSNGSTLHGHNYTYVGSTWGSIVQIMIDKRCMNPIIFIDEVDKISRTEHGREIVGILTHLLDPAQNDCFQDKYFTGIDLDLSKALFILSYNDAEAIDKILLDRVHRIKFSNLSLEDKLIICNTHILPEVYKKMGLEGMIVFSDEVLKFMIDEYTCESGVRKLKEILFEIVGEINLDVLKNNDTDFEFPIKITITDVKTKYFKDKREVIIRKVPNKSEIGYINGMYATALGSGGTLPIHAKFFPSDKFLDLKLTGLQQEVMRESMNVSLTVAWNLTNNDKQIELRSKYDNTHNKCGINIHTGDGSVRKDGPSGGCATTIVIYSLLNDIPIKAEFGVTGEIQMSGEVTAIGGLNSKILGSIKSSVKSFIFPKENQKDFNEFYEKYKNDERLVGITFYPVNHINEALELIL